MIVEMLVEGPTDEAVARRLLRHTGHESGTCFGRHGCAYIREKIGGFAQRARFGGPLLAMVDFMDFQYECPPSLAAGLVPAKPPELLLRVVVRELESWLMADVEGVAAFLRVSTALVPRAPESLPDPKQAFVNLARRSTLKRIREAIVPAEGMSASVGPGYVAEVQSYADQIWSPSRARAASQSLDRCMGRLEGLAAV